MSALLDKLRNRVREIRDYPLAKVAPIASPEIPVPVYEKAAFEPQRVPAFQKAWNFPLFKGRLLKDGWLFPQTEGLGIFNILAKKPILSRLREIIGR